MIKWIKQKYNIAKEWIKDKIKRFWKIIVGTITIAGVSAAGLSLPVDNTIPVKIQNKLVMANGKNYIDILYTDDNTDENIIIKANKQIYYGLTQSDVYFSITNISNTSSIGILEFKFKGNGELKELYKYNKIERKKTRLIATTTPYTCYTATTTKTCYKVSTSTKTITYYEDNWIPIKVNKNKATISLPLQTEFYKAIIKYPIKSKSEFIINVNSLAGHRGKLDPWLDSNWQYRKKITISAANIGTDLTNFPVYLDISQLGTDFCSNVNSDGGDIRITTSDGLTEVPREIVWIDTIACTGEVYFKAPTLSSTTDTDFYIYYGNPSATDYLDTDTYGTYNVWSDYYGVWHYQDLTDSTSNQNTGIINGNIVSTTGKIGNGYYFDGVDDYINFGSNASIDNIAYNDFSVSAWGYDQHTGSLEWGTIWSSYDTSNPTGMIVRTRNDSGGYKQFTLQVKMYDTSSTGDIWNWSSTTTNLMYPNTWYYLTAVADMTNYDGRLYINNEEPIYEAGWDTTGIPPILDDSANNKYSGGLQSSTIVQEWYGVIDELRVRKDDVIIDWVSAEYNNFVSPSTFYIIGIQEDVSTPQLLRRLLITQ